MQMRSSPQRPEESKTKKCRLCFQEVPLYQMHACQPANAPEWANINQQLQYNSQLEEEKKVEKKACPNSEEQKQEHQEELELWEAQMEIECDQCGTMCYGLEMYQEHINSHAENPLLEQMMRHEQDQFPRQLD